MPRQSSHVIVPEAKPAAKAAKPRDPVASGQRDAAHNRSASYNYFLVEKIEGHPLQAPCGGDGSS
jgi:SsrA-binding protein